METIFDIIFILFLSLLSASISMLLNYALGLADSEETSVREILSPYTLWLSTWRLKREHDEQFLADNEEATVRPVGFNHRQEEQVDPLWLQTNNEGAKKAIIDRAFHFFTWEKAFGMCIYCTGVWIAVLLAIAVSVIFKLSLIQIVSLLLCLPTISHIILRKL